LQLALRFGFKALTGVFLGWLVTRTHPKANLLVTGSLCLAGVWWALVVPGKWYLVSFALLGGGELFGFYYPYYILCCSAKSRMRRNMAYASMITWPVGFAGILFGRISDNFGLPMSFVVSYWIIAATLLLVYFGLPARPGPRESDMDASDRVPILKGKEAEQSAVA
jgi:hypothetical protein